MRWVYVIAAIPTLTEWLETGRLPGTFLESVSDLGLTLLLVGLAWLVCHQHDRILAMAETDGLTGLLNSRRFHQDLRQEIERARRQTASLALAFLDMDGFKAINDRHGHAEGDEILRRFAQLLKEGVRRHVDRCYRIGGDEFAILFPGATGPEVAKVLDRLRSNAREGPTNLGRYGAGVSGGVVELLTGEQAGEFVRRADELMYSAKSRGKDRILA